MTTSGAMEVSPSKKLRAYGPNTSAVLHVSRDLKLVSNAHENVRCLGCWSIRDDYCNEPCSKLLPLSSCSRRKDLFLHQKREARTRYMCIQHACREHVRPVVSFSSYPTYVRIPSTHVLSNVMEAVT